MKVIKCQKCAIGWLQYLINRDIYSCVKRGHEEPWSEELDARFNGKIKLTIPNLYTMVPRNPPS